MPLLWLYMWLTLNGPLHPEVDCNPYVSHPNCISYHLDRVRQSDPRYRQTSREIEQHYRKHFESEHARGSMLYTLPVIVYVIENPFDGSGSATDNDITTGIDLLNRVLDGQNPCDGNNSGISTRIQFCLASRDVYGSTTSGIVRISHAYHNVDLCTQEMALKNLVRTQEDLYPHKDYINLYIVSSIHASCIPNGESVGGFAAYPAAHGTSLDGIVIESSVLTSGSCDLFKVFVHETGHYFNLLHTFEGGCKNDDCLTDGDKVCDTPPDADQDIYPSNPCLSGGNMNSCNTDVNPSDPSNPFSSDQYDLTDNYMDYAPTSCAKHFTPGQVTRMRAALEGPRRSLLESSGCLEPCVDQPSYVLDISDDTLLIGEELVIIPTGTNIHDDSYWTLGDESFFGPDLHWNADTSGMLLFIFHPFHIDPTCTRPDTIIIRVDCYLQPQLIISDLTPEAGDTLLLTSSGSNEDGLTWYIDGQWAGQGDSLVWPVLSEGSYQVKIEYCDATCCGSVVEYVQAGECPSGLEGNLWIIARNAVTLDFSSGQPQENVPVQPPGYTDEASSIVCDKNGDLIFYTNGRYVWDRNHVNLTPNTPQISQWLRGDISATNIMSIQAPDKPYLYYIFYNTGQYGDPLGFGDDTTTLYYATIDLRQNDGFGAVVDRNVLLKRGMTEKIAATRHCNGRDWWLLSYQQSTESFLAWLIDTGGIHIPVESKVGLGSYDFRNARPGELNFSPDGSLIASATPYSYLYPDGFGAVELFHFDLTSGVVFDPLAVKFEKINYYGIEFSPNGRFLYVQHTDYEHDTRYGAISQFCLDHYQIDSIQSSEVLLDPGTKSQHALQTAKDGKIYIAVTWDPYLSVIHQPNLKGTASQYEFKGLPLTNGNSYPGLPSFPNGIYTPEKPHIRGLYEICDTLSCVKYFVSGNCKPQDQEWKILGTSSIMEVQGDTIWISPAAPGFDTLVVTRHTPCRIVTDTLIYEVNSCQTSVECSPDFQWIAADTILCPGEGLRIQYSTSATVVRISNETGQNIGVGNGSIFYQYPPPPEGDYLLYLWNPDGCDTTINFQVKHSPSLDFKWIQYDSVVCSGQIANLAFTSLAERTDLLDQNGDWIEMNPNQPMQFGPLYQDTAFLIRLRHTSWDCDTMFTCTIRVGDITSITTDSIFICPGDSVWLWSSWIIMPGEYDSLLQSSFGCDSTSIIRVVMNSTPWIEMVVINDEACGRPGSIEIIASDPSGNLEYAFNTNPFTFDATIDSLEAGEYIISVRNTSGCITKDTVEILLRDPPSISNAVVDPAECGLSNGSIQIHAYADSSPLEYSIGGSLFISDSIFTSLPAGTYQIFVKDTFGCIIEQQILVHNLDGPKINDIQIVPEYCELQNGEITILASSGSGNLYYSLDGITFSGSNLFSGLQSGIYQIVVKDNNNCEIQTSIELVSVSATTIQNVLASEAGCKMVNGVIEVVPSFGDITGYSMDRLNFQGSPLFEFIPPGGYTVYLLSHGVCLDSAITTIFERPGPAISEIVVTNPVCSDDLGQIRILAEGEPDLAYSIDGGNTWGIISVIDSLLPGEYFVIVRDSFGCNDSQYIHITVGETPALLQVETIPAICDAGGQIKVEAFGHSLEYRLNENINSLDGYFSNLKAGEYLLSVYDRNGCLLDTILSITEAGCDVFIPNVFSPNGDGLNDYIGPQFPSEDYQLDVFEIYDRWGSVVFRCYQTAFCDWDGWFRDKPSPAGVYVWRLLFTDIDGRNAVLTGDVTLIR